MQAHGLRIASGQHQGCALALLGADRSEDVDRTRPLIVRGAGPGASSGPASGSSSDPRAPRPATIVLWGCRSGGPPGSLPRGPGGFFKSLQRLRVLGIVTRASRELAVAERAQFAAQRRLAERDPKLLPDPQGQVLQPPAHHAMDRRRRAVLHPLCQGLALAVVQLAGVPGSLAVDQAFRPAGVEPHHPVPDGLQPDAADLRGFGPRAAILDFGQGQQPPTLTRIPGRFCEGPKLGCIIVRTKCNPWPHGEPPFATRESDSLRSENPRMSQPSRGLVLPLPRINLYCSDAAGARTRSRPTWRN